MSNPLLEVTDLKTEFRLSQRTVHAVNGISFRVGEGEVLGIVGESGCGKSVTALSVMRLIDTPGRIVGGEALLHENGKITDLLSLPAGEMEHVRGNKISMIFQDPMTSLNPVLNIGFQLMEPLKLHRSMSNAQAKKEAIRLLERVGISEADLRLKDYPHQFSGGMRQRVMVAMAVACQPKLLIADEPSTALDVTIQAQIIELINELKQEINTAVIIITHDLGVVAAMADRVAVMYAGNIVETGPVETIFDMPSHPYTQALMGSIPRLRYWPERLTTIEGAPPSLTEEIMGCPFAPRCIDRIEHCEVKNPALLEISSSAAGHTCACWVAQAGGTPRSRKGAPAHVA
jgi:oligopeptide/dipeptide ABC transporter ATP-binding protein